MSILRTRHFYDTSIHWKHRVYHSWDWIDEGSIRVYGSQGRTVYTNMSWFGEFSRTWKGDHPCSRWK